MNNKKIIFFENTFFAIKLSMQLDDCAYWDIVRKINITPGAKGELIELIALCVQQAENNYFYFEISDFDLCKDLSGIGGYRIGYLVENKTSNLLFDGWGQVWNGSIVEAWELGNNYSYKKNLYFIEDIKHTLNSNDKFFIESFFKRDRVYWGISKRTPFLVSDASVSVDKIKYSKDIDTIKVEKWNDLVQLRNSTHKFEVDSFDSQNLDEVLKNSLYTRADKHLPYGTAGGIDCISTYIFTNGVKNLKNGIYKVNTEQNALIFFKDFESFDILAQFCFLPDELSTPSVFLFFSVSFDEVFEKYGQRSIRLSLLTLGGALQQVHLAANAAGVSYRSIGGFDELQCGKILAIKDSEYLVCAAVMGK
jgi:SagB-type dehydrogenase family enzyme